MYPSNIKINGDGDPEIDVAGENPEEEQSGQDVMDPTLLWYSYYNKKISNLKFH